jgi:nitroimidazol reductase NimA-like FMN-containing flavoprotein (pyridoxamine 5'-phosphate oxidase superfamily)
MTTSPVLETLSRNGCEALLAGGSVGRLAVVVGEQPHIVPVNYVADGPTIVFRTAPDTILTEAALARVAFEVDGIDEHRRAGWSVSVHGYGRDITTGVDDESRRLRDLCVDCWAPDERAQWFEIVPDAVTGRYLGPPTRRGRMSGASLDGGTAEFG